MPERYDPYRLIDDVESLLRQRGFDPARVAGQAEDRVVGASRLLRGLGLEPLRALEDAVDLDGHAAFQHRLHGD
jgi:hypothetical protein